MAALREVSTERNGVCLVNAPDGRNENTFLLLSIRDSFAEKEGIMVTVDAEAEEIDAAGDADMVDAWVKDTSTDKRGESAEEDLVGEVAETDEEEEEEEEKEEEDEEALTPAGDVFGDIEGITVMLATAFDGETGEAGVAE